MNYETTNFKVKCSDQMENIYKESGIKEYELEFKICIEMVITETPSS